MARIAKTTRDHAMQQHSLAERLTIFDGLLRWIAEGAQGRPRCEKCGRALDG